MRLSGYVLFLTAINIKNFAGQSIDYIAFKRGTSRAVVALF